MIGVNNAAFDVKPMGVGINVARHYGFARHIHHLGTIRDIQRASLTNGNNFIAGDQNIPVFEHLIAVHGDNAPAGQENRAVVVVAGHFNRNLEAFNVFVGFFHGFDDFLKLLIFNFGFITFFGGFVRIAISFGHFGCFGIVCGLFRGGLFSCLFIGSFLSCFVVSCFLVGFFFRFFLRFRRIKVDGIQGLAIKSRAYRPGYRCAVIGPAHVISANIGQLFDRQGRAANINHGCRAANFWHCDQINLVVHIGQRPVAVRANQDVIGRDRLTTGKETGWSGNIQMLFAVSAIQPDRHQTPGGIEKYPVRVRTEMQVKDPLAGHDRCCIAAPCRQFNNFGREPKIEFTVHPLTVADPVSNNC